MSRRPGSASLAAVTVLGLVGAASSGCITRVEKSPEQEVVVVTSTSTPPPSTRKAAASSTQEAPRAVQSDNQQPQYQQPQYQQQSQAASSVEHAAPAQGSGGGAAGGSPLMEQASMGPYSSAAACNGAAGRWPASHGSCYQGADGSYYFTGMRQKAKR